MPNYVYHFGTKFGWLNPEGGRYWGQGEIIFLEALGHSNSVKKYLFVFNEQKLIALANVDELHLKFALKHTKWPLSQGQRSYPLYTAYSVASGIAGRHVPRHHFWDKWLELSHELETMVLNSLKEQLK